MARTPNTPSTLMTRFQKGAVAKASSLNQLSDALNRQNRGARIPAQVFGDPQGTETGLPTTVRLVLTDSTVSLTGTPTVDGSTPVAGDFILVTWDAATDGVYKVPTGGGAWQRVGKLSADDGTDKAGVYDQGTIITVYDGNSFPTAYLVGTTSVEAF